MQACEGVAVSERALLEAVRDVAVPLERFGIGLTHLRAALGGAPDVRPAAADGLIA